MTQEKGNPAVNADPEDKLQDEGLKGKESQKTDESELPEELRGKSPAELAKMIEEERKKLGSHGEKIGNLENEINYYRNLDRQRRAEEERKKAEEDEKSQTSTESSVDINELYSNPTKVIGGIVQNALKQYDEHKSKSQQMQEEQKAQSAFNKTYGRVLKKYPKKFKGYEQLVGELVKNSYKGYIVNLDGLGDEKTYIRALQMAKVEKGDRDEFWFDDEETEPIGHTETAVPSSTKKPPSDEEDIEIDDAGRHIIEQFREDGVELDDDGFKEGVRQERQRRRG
jgi:hypothetical protein